MFKKTVLALLAVLMMPVLARAATPPSACVARYLSGAQLVGGGSYRFLAIHIYDAALYAPDGQYNPAHPYALGLTYFTGLKGKKISERSISEMKHIGAQDSVALAAWQKQMDNIFPDVKEGTTLTGVRVAGGKTIFCDGDKKIGEVTDPAFGRYFFGIWLDQKSSAPGLRGELLGQP